jgi:hypothetical protein
MAWFKLFLRGLWDILQWNGYSFSTKATAQSVVYSCVASSFAGMIQGVTFQFSVVLLYSSLQAKYIEFLDIFHVLTCSCVRQLGLLSRFDMLALCARVYLAVYVLWRHKKCVLERHIVHLYNTTTGEKLRKWTITTKKKSKQNSPRVS